MKLLSVIIPCYNSQATVAATIECFEKELAGASFEIIVVNDGSTDNSVLEINRLQKIFDNIILINKDNGGVGSARNEGLKHAAGEYVWFFDSDDLLFDGVGKEIISLLSARDYDVLRFDSVTEDSQTRLHIEEYNNVGSHKTKFFGLYRTFLTLGTINFACWSVIARRSVLLDNNIFFDTELSISEDVLWNFKLAQSSLESSTDISLCYIDLKVVRYVVRENSAVNTTNIIRALHQLKSLLEYNMTLERLRADYYETPLKASIDLYLGSSRQQLVTKFLSCKLPSQENKYYATTIAQQIPADTSNKICRVFLKIYWCNSLLVLTQMIYRNIFLRHIKPHLGRN